MAEWWLGPTTADQCGHIPGLLFAEISSQCGICCSHWLLSDFVVIVTAETKSTSLDQHPLFVTCVLCGDCLRE